MRCGGPLQVDSLSPARTAYPSAFCRTPAQRAAGAGVFGARGQETPYRKRLSAVCFRTIHLREAGGPHAVRVVPFTRRSGAAREKRRAAPSGFFFVMVASRARLPVPLRAVRNRKDADFTRQGRFRGVQRVTSSWPWVAPPPESASRPSRQFISFRAGGVATFGHRERGMLQSVAARADHTGTASCIQAGREGSCLSRYCSNVLSEQGCRKEREHRPAAASPRE